MATHDDEIERLKEEVHELTSETIPDLKITLTELKGQVSNLNKVIEYFVTHSQFYPVKLIAYGLAGGVLISVLTAILSKVILK